MGFLSGLKKVGKFIGKAAPIVSMIPGVGTAAGMALGGIGGLASGGWKGALKGAAAGAIPGAIKGLRGLAGGSGILGSIGKYGGQALNFLKDNPELALSGVGAIMGARQQGKADDLVNASIERMRARDAELAPIRAQVLGSLQGPGAQREDLTNIFGGSPNPFARPLGPPPSVMPEPEPARKAKPRSSGASKMIGSPYMGGRGDGGRGDEKRRYAE